MHASACAGRQYVCGTKTQNILKALPQRTPSWNRDKLFLSRLLGPRLLLYLEKTEIRTKKKYNKGGKEKKEKQIEPNDGVEVPK